MSEIQHAYSVETFRLGDYGELADGDDDPVHAYAVQELDDERCDLCGHEFERYEDDDNDDDAWSFQEEESPAAVFIARPMPSIPHDRSIRTGALCRRCAALPDSKIVRYIALRADAWAALDAAYYRAELLADAAELFRGLSP